MNSYENPKSFTSASGTNAATASPNVAAAETLAHWRGERCACGAGAARGAAPACSCSASPAPRRGARAGRALKRAALPPPPLRWRLPL